MASSFLVHQPPLAHSWGHICQEFHAMNDHLYRTSKRASPLKLNCQAIWFSDLFNLLGCPSFHFALLPSEKPEVLFVTTTVMSLVPNGKSISICQIVSTSSSMKSEVMIN